MATTIRLGDREVELKATVRLARAVDGLGGIVAALRQVADLNLTSITVIIAAAIGERPSEIEESVYDTGIRHLAGPVAEVVELLANGGRPIESDRGTRGDGPGEG